jgi:hypothetical protein
MDPRIRKRALEAAAKVALSVTSLGGCGGKVLALEDSGAPGAWAIVGETFDASPAKTPPAPGGGDLTRDASPRTAPEASVEVDIADARVDHYEAGICGSPPLGVNAIASEGTARCCENYLRTIADASAEPWRTVAALPGTPQCCTAILSYCEGPGLVNSACAFYDVVSIVCCPLLQNASVSFCGPWGPPTPPAMPRPLDGWLA